MISHLSPFTNECNVTNDNHHPCVYAPAEIIGFKQIRLWDRMEDCTGMSGMGRV